MSGRTPSIFGASDLFRIGQDVSAIQFEGVELLVGLYPHCIPSKLALKSLQGNYARCSKKEEMKELKRGTKHETRCDGPQNFVPTRRIAEIEQQEREEGPEN